MLFNLHFIITIILYYTGKDFSHCLPPTAMHIFRFSSVRGAVAIMCDDFQGEYIDVYVALTDQTWIHPSALFTV